MDTEDGSNPMAQIKALLLHAERALAIPVQLYQQNDTVDRTAVARLMESIGPGESIGTMLVFAWALVKHLEETL
jgi:hypothetical protein